MIFDENYEGKFIINLHNTLLQITSARGARRAEGSRGPAQGAVLASYSLGPHGPMDLFFSTEKIGIGPNKIQKMDFIRIKIDPTQNLAKTNSQSTIT